MNTKQALVTALLAGLFMGMADGAQSQESAPPEPGFYMIRPCRVVDTSQNAQQLDGGAVLSVPVLGNCGIPKYASGVLMNIRVRGSGGDLGFPGHLRVWSGEDSIPLARALHWGSGRQEMANRATVAFPRAGKPLSVYAGFAQGQSADLIVDVYGYYLGNHGLAARAIPIIFESLD